MAIEPLAPGARPRPWLLALLGVVIVVFVWSRMFSGGSVPAAVSTTNPRAPGGSQGGQIDPSELDVRIEALKQAPAGPADGDRNPFRFQPKAPPPPPPSSTVPRPQQPTLPPPPAVPAGPPAIGTLIKFIGIIDTGAAKIGAFSDCRYTFSGREGEIIEGRFRVVRIGVESAILEYTDGQGRTTLPLNGQACVK